MGGAAVMPPTTAGKMRRRFEIQKNTPTRGLTGESIAVWNSIAEVWGAIEQLKGEERWMQPSTAATAAYKITMRYHPEVKPPRQLKMGTRKFDINSVTNLEERNRWMVVIAQELLEPTRG